MDELIHGICRRAFGAEVEVLGTRELGGGTFNTTYQISLRDRQVIVRIAPPDIAALAWHERSLMRREHAIQPYFAALGPLMPRTLLVDFTRELTDRDYMVQTQLVGERWEEVAEELNHAEQLHLWGQFGSITRTIHATTGTAFGGPPPAPEYNTWSAAVFAHLEQAHAAMHAAQLPTDDLEAIVASAHSRAALFDEVRQPRLLHGDLWLFNLLVTRTPAGPQISGVLDADRAWWGDPLADWTMFLLAKTSTPATEPLYAAFWRTYGHQEPTPALHFRRAIYEAMHVSTALAWAAGQGDDETLARGRRDLQDLVTQVSTDPPE